MTDNVIPFRLPGQYWLAEIPQRGSVDDMALRIGGEWRDFDALWKCYPGQFTVVTGIAGHGKSTFVQNLVVQFAQKHDTKSFLYVPENESYVVDKFKHIWGKRPGLDKFLRSQCMIQSSAPEYYDDQPKTMDWVLNGADDAVRRFGIDLVVIDPWNELERARSRDQTTSDYIVECLQYVKNFTRSLSVAVIIVVHPTKEGIKDGRVPGLTDCEGSLAWHNKSDNGLIVYRDPKLPNTSIVISQKVREIGAGLKGRMYFLVDPSTGIFTPQENALLIDR